MQVFCPYASPLATAQCLDKKRLNRQIQEAKVILNAINGKGKGWFNHPVTKMYRNHSEWLENYRYCLESYNCGFLRVSKEYNKVAMPLTPPFLTEEFCNQHKRRLYTKNPEYYEEFAEYGTSEENWYYIEGEIVKYINGKKIE